MNSLQTHYFLHLCRTLSVSETARQLFVAQPAVSKQIAGLEKELGFSLFYRTNRGVTLTPGGSLLYEFFSRTQEEYRHVHAEAKRRMRAQKDTLVIGLLENLGLDELQPVISALKQEHSGLDVTLVRLDNTTLMERLSDGRLDAAITFDHAMEHRSGVRYVELLLEQSMFVISRDHPLAQREHIIPQNLSGQIICEPLSRDGNLSDSYLRHLLNMLGIRPIGYLQVDNLASGLAAVETNHTVGLIDERVQLLHPERYRLIPSGTYQSVVCASLEGNRNPYVPLLTEALQNAFAVRTAET